MRMLSVLSFTLVASLAGCAYNHDLVPDEDGVGCAHSMGADAVHIDIPSYREGPKGDCEVDQGTVITWRAPRGETRPFELVFTSSSPAGPREPLQHASREARGRQKVSLVADGPPGSRHPYEIRVNGRVLDPAIIIR